VTGVAGVGTGVLGGSGYAQDLPDVATGTTDTTQTQTAPPPAPVSDPGPLSDATTHENGDAARRGAVTGGGLRPPLRSLWRQDFDALVSNAVVGDGRAYVLSGGRVVALDLVTGQRLWTSAAQLRASGLAFGGGKVIAGGNGTVALDAATGAVAWSTGDDSLSGAPLIAGDLVIVQDQGLTAYDLATGAARWTGGDSDGVSGAPAAAGDRIFQIGGCTVAAVDRRNGNVLWRRNRGCSGGTSGTVALQGDKVHSSFGDLPLSAADGANAAGPKADILAGEIGLQRETDGIAAVSFTSGQLMWRTGADTSVINDTLGAPLVVADTVFQTRFEGTVEARALATGAVTWKARLRAAKETFTGSSSASDFTQAAGPGVLLVLRGSTVDALGAAPEPPASLSIAVPRLASRLIEAGVDQVIRGAAAGDLWPAGVIAETDPYPFGRFAPAGAAAVPVDPQGNVRMSVKTDRNVRVRLVGTDGGAAATRSYTLFAYPRIRFQVRNVANRVRARVTVTGSRALRFRGRRVHVYLARARQGRMVKLGSARLSGPRRRTGRAVVRFPAVRRFGRRDFLFACVPAIHRLGQGAADPVQRRCGRSTIKF